MENIEIVQLFILWASINGDGDILGWERGGGAFCLKNDQEWRRITIFEMNIRKKKSIKQEKKTKQKTYTHTF